MVKILIKPHTYGSDCSYLHERTFLKVIDAITFLINTYEDLSENKSKHNLCSKHFNSLSQNYIIGYQIKGNSLYIIEDKIQKLTLNSIQCLQCKQVLVSKHQHDFVMCSCSNEAFVDGGLAYSRVGANDLKQIKNLNTYTWE